MVVISLLQGKMNREPLATAEEAVRIFELISKSESKIGVFDEPDFFSGEIALIAATAFRHLGKFEIAERWLDRADGSFRLTVDPGPATARVAYARLAIRYDRRESDRVLEALPSLIQGFQRLRMVPELRKARFLEGMALKQSGDDLSALTCFEKLRADLPNGDIALLPRVLIEIGSEQSRQSRFEEAVVTFEQAADLLTQASDPVMLADLKGTIAETYRAKGELNVAVDCYRVALAQFAKLGMQARVAYYRVIIAETLLLADRAREAEWEILAALPVIEEQKMLSEGVAAVGLLRESVRRRNTDQNALRDIRHQLGKLA